MSKKSKTHYKRNEVRMERDYSQVSMRRTSGGVHWCPWKRAGFCSIPRAAIAPLMKWFVELVE